MTALLLFLLLAPEPVKVATGFRFTEGPAADKEGNVFFSDIPNERIHRLGVDGKVTVFREKSGRANGLMFNATGELVACEGGTGRVVAIAPDGKKVRVLAENYGGKRFNAPNDLVIDKQGGIYFTDPEFGRNIKKPQGTFAVYYIAAPGKVTRVIESLPRPNGIMLSPDQKTLYVAPSRSAKMMAYPVTAPGKLGKGRVFYELKQPEGRKDTGGDGMTVDANGNLYFTSWLGVQVVSPEGKHLRTIKFPEKPANVTLVGGRKLYVTARTSVYTFLLAGS
ncbi:MAG: SMP-30/gluconolactonase/LRE family protein [Planctomycetota bacterium]